MRRFTVRRWRPFCSPVVRVDRVVVKVHRVVKRLRETVLRRQTGTAFPDRKNALTASMPRRGVVWEPSPVARAAVPIKLRSEAYAKTHCRYDVCQSQRWCGRTGGSREKTRAAHLLEVGVLSHGCSRAEPVELSVPTSHVSIRLSGSRLMKTSTHCCGLLGFLS